jgi:hypothetical protein
MVKLSEIPFDLKRGDLYKSLKETLDTLKDIPIDEKYMMSDFSIDNLEKFKRVISVSRYWMLYRLPIEVYIYFFFHSDEVLSYIKTLDDIVDSKIKTDFLYNIDLVKYKYEIISYVFYTYAEEKMPTEILYDLNMLENTPYYKLDIEVSRKERNILLKVDQYNEIIKNPEIHLTLILRDNGRRIEIPFIVFRKINTLIHSIARKNLFSFIKEALLLNNNYESKDMFIRILKNRIQIDGHDLFITKINRDYLIYQFEELDKIVKQIITSFLPTKMILMNCFEDISSYREDSHKDNLLSIMGENVRIRDTYQQLEDWIKMYDDIMGL